jgi:hypothetical protein
MKNHAHEGSATAPAIIVDGGVRLSQTRNAMVRVSTCGHLRPPPSSRGGGV